MIKQKRQYTSELAVIGAGIAGCAATTFALARGIKTTQIGNTGALAYTSGYFDLLGAVDAKTIKNPWSGLAQLRHKEPGHPYAKITDDTMRNAFDEFISSLDDMGLGYNISTDDNYLAMLPAGACKPTFCLPRTMQNGTQAMLSRAKVLVVDFVGLQGFSASEIAANLKSEWPLLRTQRISFPEMETGAQVFPEVMARAMEVASTREEFGRRLNAIAGDAEYIALPAMLGIHQPDFIHGELEKMVGLPIFEIPTIPPAVPGIRLRELFEQQLSLRGATVITQQKVRNITFNKDNITLTLQDSYGPVEVKANNIILASGRFLSGGLKADQHKVQEALIDLPVQQPQDREGWFSESYFDPAGHAINRSGVMINDLFQALDQHGDVIDQRLYAAGILLANQDWIRQRCGAGLAIASAYKAINSITDKS